MTQQFLFKRPNRLKERQLDALREPDYVLVNEDGYLVQPERGAKLPWSNKPWHRVKSISWLRLLRELVSAKSLLIRESVRETVELEEKHQREIRALERVQERRLKTMDAAIQKHLGQAVKVIIPRDGDAVAPPAWVDDADDVPF